MPHASGPTYQTRDARELAAQLVTANRGGRPAAPAVVSAPRGDPAYTRELEVVVRAVREWILRLKQSGLAILLSEQNVKFALEVSDRAYVIDKGAIRHQGRVEELRENEEVRKRYLMV